MVSYKEWQSMMNESFVGTFASLLSNPNAQPFEEGKKKKMDAGTMGTEKDAETGDGEVVDAASEKDEKGDKDKKFSAFFQKKESKEVKCDDDKGKKGMPFGKKKDDAAAKGSEEEGEDKGKKLPPWLQKKEAKDSSGLNPEG